MAIFIFFFFTFFFHSPNDLSVVAIFIFSHFCLGEAFPIENWCLSISICHLLKFFHHVILNMQCGKALWQPNYVLSRAVELISMIVP